MFSTPFGEVVSLLIISRRGDFVSTSSPDKGQYVAVLVATSNKQSVSGMLLGQTENKLLYPYQVFPVITAPTSLSHLVSQYVAFNQNGCRDRIWSPN